MIGNHEHKSSLRFNLLVYLKRFRTKSWVFANRNSELSPLQNMSKNTNILANFSTCSFSAILLFISGSCARQLLNNRPLMRHSSNILVGYPCHFLETMAARLGIEEIAICPDDNELDNKRDGINEAIKEDGEIGRHVCHSKITGIENIRPDLAVCGFVPG